MIKRAVLRFKDGEFEFLLFEVDGQLRHEQERVELLFSSDQQK